MNYSFTLTNIKTLSITYTQALGINSLVVCGAAKDPREQVCADPPTSSVEKPDTLRRALLLAQNTSSW